jgi:hypothetical protein
MDLANVNVSKELGLKIEFINNQVKLSLGLDTNGVDASISVMLEVDYFLDKLAAAIPGTIDNTIIELLKAGLKVAK